MKDITQEEYEKITQLMADRVTEIRQDEPLAMVRRQIPIESMRSFRDGDTVEIVFRLELPVSSIKKVLHELRSR